MLFLFSPPQPTVSGEKQQRQANSGGGAVLAGFCQRSCIGDADLMLSLCDRESQKVCVCAGIGGFLSVHGDVKAGVIGDCQHEPAVLLHLNAASHGVITEGVVVQLPRADFRGGVLQHLIFHGVHHRFGNDIIAGRKFQFQFLNGLVGGKRVLEVVVIVLVHWGSVSLLRIPLMVIATSPVVVPFPR